MVSDTFPHEKLALEHRHTFAAWTRVTGRIRILACLAVGFTFSVVTAVLERVLPHRGPPTATQVDDRKTLRRFPYVAVVSLTVALVACGGGPASQAPASSTRPPALLKLTSSLDGQTALPLRTQWIASPEPADAVVAKVDFLIDGKLIWNRRPHALRLRPRRRLPDHDLAYARATHVYSQSHRRRGWQRD